jgi:hypothetical protein
MDTFKKPPPYGSTQWFAKTIARELGVSDDVVGRMLRADEIHLNRGRTWCVSNDPNYSGKTADVVGLCLHPPKNTLVIAYDENTSMQAVERPNGFVTNGNGTIVRGRNSACRRRGTANLLDTLDIKAGTA